MAARSACGGEAARGKEKDFEEKGKGLRRVGPSASELSRIDPDTGRHLASITAAVEELHRVRLPRHVVN